MSGEDDLELEMILARKRRELMLKAAMTRKERGEGGGEEEKEKRDPVEGVKSVLYDRGDEVLEAALSQYPEEARVVVEKLAELVEAGRLPDKLSGGQLLALFHQLGLDVHVKSRILVEKEGKFVPLADAIREEEK